MADWRQIQARIRKAKVGADAPAKLTQLFDKTRDGMVAFELAAILEREGRPQEAVGWYATAVKRFRRADWKKKAQEAVERLGGEVPQEVIAPAAETPQAEPERIFAEAAEEPVVEPLGEPEAAQPETAAPPVEAPQAAGERPKRRRRGRRGGRGRRKHAAREPQRAAPQRPAAPAAVAPEQERPRSEPRPFEAESEAEAEAPVPRPAWQPSFRAGEPALASRMAKLESQLRRLLAGATTKLDKVDEAPAGPGVFILSDSDQVTHYYVEACQTLRIALAQLVKSGRGGRRGASVSLRPVMAEHLGISESKVKDYLKKHCVVRWLQLDEGASQLAHFAIAVLRPALNE